MIHAFYLVLLLLAGCANLGVSPEQQQKWQQIKPALSKIETWQLRGRLALHANNDSWIANVLWEQQPSNYQLQFNTPTGQGALRLNRSGNTVTLTTAEGKIFTASTAEELLSERLHIQLPVSYLQEWIRGLPTEHERIDGYQLDEMGRLSSLQQTNWDIQYERYVAVKDVYLPSKMTLENQQFKIKIIISRWEI
jgi:outer membrane lipoprotein LolB